MKSVKREFCQGKERRAWVDQLPLGQVLQTVLLAMQVCIMTSQCFQNSPQHAHQNSPWHHRISMARFDWGKDRLPKDQALARPDVPHFAPLEGWRHRVFGQLSCKCTDQNSGLLPTCFFLFFIFCGCRLYDSCLQLFLRAVLEHCWSSILLYQ